jgi:hypothetical protein
VKQTKINEILEKHKLWLEGREGGVRANLSGKKLYSKNLQGVDLRNANIIDADLRDANLTGTDLRDANLTGTDLTNANLCCANLQGVDFRGANLRFANLTGTNLIIINLPIWEVYIYENTVRIGCKHHNHDEWLNFNDDEIHRMHSDALEWWNEYRPLIINGIDFMKAKVAKKRLNQPYPMKRKK